jgi:hypothetical protein
VNGLDGLFNYLLLMSFEIFGSDQTRSSFWIGSGTSVGILEGSALPSGVIIGLNSFLL